MDQAGGSMSDLNFGIRTLAALYALDEVLLVPMIGKLAFFICDHFRRSRLSPRLAKSLPASAVDAQIHDSVRTVNLHSRGALGPVRENIAVAHIPGNLFHKLQAGTVFHGHDPVGVII